MLREIRIQGLGVIEDATLPLSTGLNVLTGETGAGKTMVVSALGLLLGARAAGGRVRQDSAQATVEGLVEVPPGHPARKRVEEAGGDSADLLILARSVAESGRSRAFVGGRSAPVSVLADLGELLVAVHGQADQWRLQRPDQHRAVLDTYGGAAVATALQAYQSRLRQWQSARRELTQLTTDARERAQRAALLSAALEEIERVDPRPGEDEELKSEATRLTHVDALQEAAGAAQVLLAGDDDQPQSPDGAVAQIAQARSALAAVSDQDRQIAAIQQRLHELGILAADIVGDLAAYLADVDADPARLAQINDRRSVLTSLMRSYGDSIEEVLAWSRSAAAESATLAGADDRIESLQEQVAALAPEVGKAAAALSQARTTAALSLGSQVSAELAHLAMGSATVRVRVAQEEKESGLLLPDGRRVQAHEHGIDEVEIQLSAGSGQEPRSVAKAASGGELSRVMLALEVVTAAGDVPTFVFDEVDAGIGGAAALDVGARLKRLAEQSQVIVVTHLAQVAAYADHHLVVHKHDDGQITASGIAVVEGVEREAELARMLGGRSESATAREHARELLASTRAATPAKQRQKRRPAAT